MITILTPTYNREKTLTKAYKSLVSQTNMDFEWLIIDDGSTDNTKKLIYKFKKECKINITYFYKENGGKHTALNFGIKKAKGELILTLDSDDYLNNNAVEIVKQYWSKYKNNKKIAGITFLRKINNPIYKVKGFSECVSNSIDFRYNNNLLADMCEVIRTEILKKYPYPVFKGERFLSEAIVTNKIAEKYNMAYVPIEIYNTTYLDDGLSKKWLKTVVNNPNGARANSLIFMSRSFKFRIRLKNCITFNIYSIISKNSILKETKMKFFSILFYIPSYIVAKILIKKYKK